MRTTRVGEVIAVAVGAVLAVFLTVPPAVAAPPSNDDIHNAQVIARVPTSVAVDSREATTEPASPASECVAGNSVWYRLNAQRGFTGRVLTSNSDFDPMIAIFTGPPNALTLLACNDDAVSGSLEARVEVRFLSGHTYYIALTSGSAPTSVDSLPATTWSSLEGSASCPPRTRRSFVVT